MHSRSTTRTRRAAGTFAIVAITIGTLPNGSMTSSNKTAAEKISAACKGFASMKLDARLKPATHESADRVQRDAKVAVDRDLVQLVERCVHDARDQPLNHH